MSGIKLVLLTGVVFIALYLLVRWRKQVLDVIFLCVLVIAAIVFILYPDLTTAIANKLGVGRGADLVFYISILIFWFILLKFYMRIRRLEQTVTAIIRDNAIKQAHEPSKDNSSKPSHENKQQ
jgi:hypothetical protein